MYAAEDRLLQRAFFKEYILSLPEFTKDQLVDITFGESFKLILNMMVESIRTVMHPTKEQVKLILEVFIRNLPEYLKNSLARAVTVA